MRKNMIIMLFVILVVPLMIGICLRYINFPFISGSGDAWIGYWSSFLGSGMGVIGAFWIMQNEFKNQLKNKKIEESIEIYNNFILKYYYKLLIICRYENDPYGGDKKLSCSDISDIKIQVIKDMLGSSRYINSELLQNVSEWNLYDRYLNDLRGYHKEFLEASIMVNFDKLMEENYELNKNENLLVFITNFKPYALLSQLEVLSYNYCFRGSTSTSDIDISKIDIAKTHLFNRIYSDIPSEKEERLRYYKSIEEKINYSTQEYDINEYIKSLFKSDEVYY